jgi:hypothetical protein
MKVVPLLFYYLLWDSAMACSATPAEQLVSPEKLITRTENIVIANLSRSRRINLIKSALLHLDQ